MLVFSADLEEVEEVGCGGMDGDEVFVWLGRRGGEFGDGEVVRSLRKSAYFVYSSMCPSHDTLTYSLIWIPFMVRLAER